MTPVKKKRQIKVAIKTSREIMFRFVIIRISELYFFYRNIFYSQKDSSVGLVTVLHRLHPAAFQIKSGTVTLTVPIFILIGAYPALEHGCLA